MIHSGEVNFQPKKSVFAHAQQIVCQQQRYITC